MKIYKEDTLKLNYLKIIDDILNLNLSDKINNFSEYISTLNSIKNDLLSLENKINSFLTSINSIYAEYSVLLLSLKSLLNSLIDLIEIIKFDLNKINNIGVYTVSLDYTGFYDEYRHVYDHIKIENEIRKAFRDYIDHPTGSDNLNITIYIPGIFNEKPFSKLIDIKQDIEKILDTILDPEHSDTIKKLKTDFMDLQEYYINNLLNNIEDFFKDDKLIELKLKTFRDKVAKKINNYSNKYLSKIFNNDFNYIKYYRDNININTRYLNIISALNEEEQALEIYPEYESGIVDTIYLINKKTGEIKLLYLNKQTLVFKLYNLLYKDIFKTLNNNSSEWIGFLNEFPNWNKYPFTLVFYDYDEKIDTELFDLDNFKVLFTLEQLLNNKLDLFFYEDNSNLDSFYSPKYFKSSNYYLPEKIEILLDSNLFNDIKDNIDNYEIVMYSFKGTIYLNEYGIENIYKNKEMLLRHTEYEGDMELNFVYESKSNILLSNKNIHIKKWDKYLVSSIPSLNELLKKYFPDIYKILNTVLNNTELIFKNLSDTFQHLDTSAKFILKGFSEIINNIFDFLINNFLNDIIEFFYALNQALDYKIYYVIWRGSPENDTPDLLINSLHKNNDIQYYPYGTILHINLPIHEFTEDLILNVFDELNKETNNKSYEIIINNIKKNINTLKINDNLNIIHPIILPIDSNIMDELITSKDKQLQNKNEEINKKIKVFNNIENLNIINNKIKISKNIDILKKNL